MKSKLISGAAVVLDTPEVQLAYSNGLIQSKLDEKKNISINDVASRMRERVLVTTGAR